MGLFSNFSISGSAMSGQTIRLNTIASNMANADTVSSSQDKAYKARQTVFQTMMMDKKNPELAGVKMAGIVESNAPVIKKYDPSSPFAGEDGYVFATNVDTVEEMVNMLSASRSYQNNVEVLNTSKDLLIRTLSLGS